MSALQNTVVDGQVPDAPAELKEWGQQTALGVYFGLLVGGARQYVRDRSTSEFISLFVLHLCSGLT